ncbi:hypothetical protein [Geotalea sp. SG265]|uniref:hypothetical protein n=1 Tax=Geotalea sp. SG265 TaxID=2922867 RepID=UPI001FAE7BE2|nr:hypothetical protein [Geotalea sp. SG265]
MRHIFLLLLTVVCLTGCSELRIIGAAAMNELRSEGINAEMAAYKQPDPMAEEPTPEVKPVVVARAVVTPVARAKNYRKGAWEHL